MQIKKQIKVKWKIVAKINEKTKDKKLKAQKNAEEERNTIDPSNIVSQLKQDREDDLVR